MSLVCSNSGGLQSRICLDNPAQVGKDYLLTGAEAQKLALWQVRPGEAFTLGDAAGNFFRARLKTGDNEVAEIAVFEKLAASPESSLRMDVYQALPEKERFEWILQKLTELGVFRLAPFVSQRSTTPEERDAGQKKSHRWPQVVLRAARQCRRAMIPELLPPLSWPQLLQECGQAPVTLVLSELEKEQYLKDLMPTLADCSHVALIVGPEGGFTTEEVGAFRTAGFHSLSLGPRILRTETAALTGAALLQSRYGDLG